MAGGDCKFFRPAPGSDNEIMHRRAIHDWREKTESEGVEKNAQGYGGQWDDKDIPPIIVH